MRRKVINMWTKDPNLEQAATTLLTSLNRLIGTNKANHAELISYGNGGLMLIGTKITEMYYNKLLKTLS